jgi:selenide, water dikinase
MELPVDPNLIIGAKGCDDAGVYRLTEDTALIQTVDFFTPVVDDPYLFGQITAANALSDVYAMGGKPILAMNLVCFPIEEMDPGILKEILKGGLDKINEAGALLVGGHSIEDKEIKYGLSVTGTVHPDQVLLNSGARPGDNLLLTKPLGTGILSTAIKGGLVDKSTEEVIARVMSTLNRTAGELAAENRVNGCTDITGFGLLGHLCEVAEASKVSISIEASRVPVLDKAYDFSNMGIIPEGSHKNKEFYQKKINCNLAARDPLEMILYDPQTSGGLLISAPASKTDLIISAMNDQGYPYETAVIGKVEAGSPGKITVNP